MNRNWWLSRKVGLSLRPRDWEKANCLLQPQSMQLSFMQGSWKGNLNSSFCSEMECAWAQTQKPGPKSQAQTLKPGPKSQAQIWTCERSFLKSSNVPFSKLEVGKTTILGFLDLKARAQLGLKTSAHCNSTYFCWRPFLGLVMESSIVAMMVEKQFPGLLFRLKLRPNWRSESTWYFRGITTSWHEHLF